MRSNQFIQNFSNRKQRKSSRAARKPLVLHVLCLSRVHPCPNLPFFLRSLINLFRVSIIVLHVLCLSRVPPAINYLVEILFVIHGFLRQVIHHPSGHTSQLSEFTPFLYVNFFVILHQKIFNIHRQLFTPLNLIFLGIFSSSLVQTLHHIFCNQLQKQFFFQGLFV